MTTPSAAAARPTNVRYFVLLVLCLITFINYVQRNCIAPAETTVRADLRLTKKDTGEIASVFFFVYALLQIPSGWLGQQWGPRTALAVFAVGWSAALALAALASGYWGLLTARMAIGALQAGIFPCCTLAVVAWLPATRRAFASAMLNSFMLIGGAVGAQLSGVLLEPLGWRGLFACYAVPGVVWSAFFWVWFRDRPENHSAVNHAELEIIGAQQPPTPATDAPARPRAALAVVFLSLTMWLVGIQQAFRAGANRFYDNWLPTYLQEDRTCSKELAADLSSWPQYAGVIGGLIGGLLSDWVLKRTGSRRAGRQGVAIASLLIGSLFFVAAYFTPEVRAAVLLLSAGAFITMFAAPCAYALTMDLGGRNLGVVFGTMNMVGNLGAFAFVWAAGYMAETRGWNSVLILFAAAHVAAALCWLLINPNGVIGAPNQANSDLSFRETRS